MSAYVVSDNQISAILQGVYGVNHSGFNIWETMIDPDAYHYVPGAGVMHQQEANILMKENVRSVNHRYNDMQEFVGNVQLDRFAKPLPVINVLKLIDNLQYQSCECDDFHKSQAFKLINEYRYSLINRLDGYSDAPWGL